MRGKKKEEGAELTIDKRIEDHYTLKCEILGINTKSISNSARM
jgi:hypothetical protein